MASRLTVSRVCECNVCGIEEMTRRTELPTGWAIIWENNYTICRDCRRRWAKRFGKEPEYSLEGNSIYDW